MDWLLEADVSEKRAASVYRAEVTFQPVKIFCVLQTLIFLNSQRLTNHFCSIIVCSFRFINLNSRTQIRWIILNMRHQFWVLPATSAIPTKHAQYATTKQRCVVSPAHTQDGVYFACVGRHIFLVFPLRGQRTERKWLISERTITC